MSKPWLGCLSTLPPPQYFFLSFIHSFIHSFCTYINAVLIKAFLSKFSNKMSLFVSQTPAPSFFRDLCSRSWNSHRHVALGKGRKWREVWGKECRGHRKGHLAEPQGNRTSTKGRRVLPLGCGGEGWRWGELPVQFSFSTGSEHSVDQTPVLCAGQADRKSVV